jgi:ubiquinone/menaquinone biosynthesis C-methylase UbiE
VADQVVGVDVSPAATKAAHTRYPRLEAHIGNVLALPFEDREFEVIVSNSTLDHFDSHAKLRAAVRELGRVLAMGGKLLITLDNRLNPIVAVRTSALFGALRRIGVVPYFLGVTYGPRGLSRVLHESGFELLEITSVMHCPPQIAAHLAARGERAASIDQAAYTERVLRFEAMARWPTRHLTGHFVGALAVKL